MPTLALNCFGYVLGVFCSVVELKHFLRLTYYYLLLIKTYKKEKHVTSMALAHTNRDL